MVLGLLGCGVSGVEETPAPDSEEQAEEVQAPSWTGVGVMTLSVALPDGEETLAEVWYPAVETEGREPETYGLGLSLQAVREAEIAAGIFPVVAFSHGLGGFRLQSASLMETIAEAGFVVVAPDHRGSTWVDLDRAGVVASAVRRPAEIRRSVETVESPDGPFGESVNPAAPYGVVGHSFGSVTAMMMGGASADLEGFGRFCEEAPQSFGCDFLGQAKELDLSGQRWREERVASAVLLAPGLHYVFTESSLQGVPEVLVIAAEEDEVLPYEEEALALWLTLPSGTPLLSHREADHLTPFTEICEIPIGLAQCAGDAPVAQKAQTSRVVASWLTTVLKPDARNTGRWRNEVKKSEREGSYFMWR